MDQLRGKLIEFDRAIVVGRYLLATVEGGGGEIGRQAANRDDIGAAVEALRERADVVVGQGTVAMGPGQYVAFSD